MVLMLTTNWSAIPRLLSPCAASRATTSSCDVSPARSRPFRLVGLSPDAASSAMHRSQVRGRAEGGEPLLSGRQQVGGPPALTDPAQEPPGRQFDARPFEGHGEPVRRRQRDREGRLRVLGATGRCLQHAARSGQPGDLRATPAFGRQFLVADEEAVGVLDPAHRDQRVGEQVLPRPEPGLVDGIPVGEPAERVERGDDLVGVAAGLADPGKASPSATIERS